MVASTRKKQKRKQRRHRRRQARAREEADSMRLMELMFLFFLAVVQLSLDKVRTLFGGNKTEERHRERKDLEVEEMNLKRPTVRDRKRKTNSRN